MNSATSTESRGVPPASSTSSRPASQATFLPWHFFLLAVLASATAAVLAARGNQPLSALVTLVLIVAAAGFAGFAVLRTLRPLVSADAGDQAEMVGRRTRAALEQQKALVLRALKELEFDHAMGKVSEDDWHEMTGRLRARAAGVMRQLEGNNAYRTLIERELADRLAARIRSGEAQAAPPASGVEAPGAATADGPFCTQCGARNEGDARFCKACGHQLT